MPLPPARIRGKLSFALDCLENLHVVVERKKGKTYGLTKLLSSFFLFTLLQCFSQEKIILFLRSKRENQIRSMEKILNSLFAYVWFKDNLIANANDSSSSFFKTKIKHESSNYSVNQILTTAAMALFDLVVFSTVTFVFFKRSNAAALEKMNRLSTREFSPSNDILPS